MPLQMAALVKKGKKPGDSSSRLEGSGTPEAPF
jgi:hypothetical protein